VDDEWQWTQDSYPADAVSLRSVTSDNFVVVASGENGEERVIGETDFTSGPSTLHEKAIYLVEGQLFQVDRFDYEGRKAFVSPVECDYYTTAITYNKVTILETFESAPGPCHGEVHVVWRVVGFKKIKFYTHENVGSGELDLPEQNMHTTSYWLTIAPDTMSALPYSTTDRRDGVIGLAHAMRNVAPLLLMCDSHDLGLSVDGIGLEGTLSPTIFIYDAYPSGIGFSEPLYGMHDQLIARTRELIEGCPCESGCPSCVGPEGAAGPQAKAVALHLLRVLTAAEVAA
jgi:DEAD/DEAH box helicase domain-containing protein